MEKIQHMKKLEDALNSKYEMIKEQKKNGGNSTG